MTTRLTLSRVQRDNLRSYVSNEALGIAVDAFPSWDHVPEDRKMVLDRVEEARLWLGLLDRIGWEFEANADECVVELDGHQAEMLVSLEDEIRNTYEYDHRDDDKVLLDAIRSLRTTVA